MPSPNQIFTELVSTTFRKHRKDIKDNTSNHNALLRKLNAKGSRKVNGGLSIVTPLEYAQNSTFQRYSGYDILNIGASDVITSAEYQWRQIALSVVASGMELRVNAGDAQIIDLVKSRMKNATHTFRNLFSSDVYSDGTLPNQINGLQALVGDTGGGTVGGIDADTWTFWKNKVQSAASPLQGGSAITVSSTTIENDLMLPLYLATTRGSDVVDLIVCSNDYFTLFEKSQVSLKRYTSAEKGQGGFMELKYKNADVIFDGGSGIPNSRMYFLNTDLIELVEHPDADLREMPELRPVNQDAAVTPILWMGNLTCSNRARQGVLKP